MDAPMDALPAWSLTAWVLAVLSVLGAVLLLVLVGALVHAQLARARAPASPVVLYLYMPPGGTPRGPADLTRLLAMVADGRLDAETLAAPVGSDHWQPLSLLLGRSPR
jgi:hypothetical protein